MPALCPSFLETLRLPGTEPCSALLLIAGRKALASVRWRKQPTLPSQLQLPAAAAQSILAGRCCLQSVKGSSIFRWGGVQ